MKFNHIPGTAELTTSHATITVTHADGQAVAAVVANAIKHRLESWHQIKLDLLKARIALHHQPTVEKVVQICTADMQDRHSRQLIHACTASLLAGLAIGVAAMWGMLP